LAAIRLGTSTPCATAISLRLSPGCTVTTSGPEFDAFIKDKLDVARADGIDDAFEDLLSGKADYLIAGYYPGLAEAAKDGIKDQIEVMDQALLTAEMFVAFSKKSPCTALADKFGQAITEMTTDGSFDAILAKATADWDAAQAKP
jgi:polar amino acid transport system substrate-binding protein